MAPTSYRSAIRIVANGILPQTMPSHPLHSRWATRVATVAILAVVAASSTFHPAESRADGDPASDVLLGQDVFYPYQPKVDPDLEAAMEKTLHAAARAAGLHLKVAIIGAPEELGLVPTFFGHPQAYAEFLDREISFNQPQQLLVVMPAGFGAIPTGLAHGLAGVPVYRQQRSNGLTRSAMLAVVALARSQGHPIATPSISPSSSSSSPPALLVFGLPVALLALAGLVMMRRGRSRSAEHPPNDR
jgi:hypothetical protein